MARRGVRSQPSDQLQRRDLLADAKLPMPRGLGWFAPGTEQPVPYGKQHAKVLLIVVRIDTVMDRVVSRRHDERPESWKLPANVQMHPVVLEHDEEDQQQLEPIRRRAEQWRGEYICQIDQA